jgi:hypothetical protein
MKVMERKETESEQKVYWTDKNPCWEACHCPSMIKDECPATRYQFLACWEIEGTYCKLNDYGATGKDTSICEVCRVYKKYGSGEPIQLKLFGRGINTKIAELEKISKR